MNVYEKIATRLGWFERAGTWRESEFPESTWFPEELKLFKTSFHWQMGAIEQLMLENSKIKIHMNGESVTYCIGDSCQIFTGDDLQDNIFDMLSYLAENSIIAHVDGGSN